MLCQKSRVQTADIQSAGVQTSRVQMAGVQTSHIQTAGIQMSHIEMAEFKWLRPNIRRPNVSRQNGITKMIIFSFKKKKNRYSNKIRSIFQEKKPLLIGIKFN